MNLNATNIYTKNLILEKCKTNKINSHFFLLILKKELNYAPKASLCPSNTEQTEAN